MFFIKDTEKSREMLSVKVYDELYKCSNCGEDSLERISFKLFECENCGQRYLGFTLKKMKELEAEGKIKEIP